MSDEPESEPDVEEIAEDMAQHNRDPQTRREAIELELEEQGRSEEGETLGDHIN